MSDKKNHVRLTQLPIHPRSIAESMQVPDRVVQEDRMTQPEWAMGKAGLQQLATISAASRATYCM